MEELQSHLEDLGFNEENQEEEAEVKKSKMKIPGKKKVLKILKKTRKQFGRKKKEKGDEKIVE